jgi:hypothetical protein
VKQTSDGGFMISATTESFGNLGNDVLWLIRTDENGDTLWTKIIEGTETGWGNSISQTTDGGFIITGNSENTDADVSLIKTDSLGNIIWQKAYGGDKDERGYSVQETFDKGYIVIGYTESFGSGLVDFWLIRTDSNGDTLWARTYGGEEEEYGKSICQTLDAGYIAVGTTVLVDTIINGNKYVDGINGYIIRIDENGDSLWTKTIADCGFKSVNITSDGGYIITGYVDIGGPLREDFLLIRMDEDGNTLWVKTLAGDERNHGHCVQQTFDRGYFITGTKEFILGGGDVWLIRTNANGDTLWTKTIGGDGTDQGMSGCQTSDGGFIAVGYTSTFGLGWDDVWLIRINPESSTSIYDIEIIKPSAYLLFQNYPNPFNPTTIIKYQLPELSFVTLQVYDVLGREIITLVNEEKPIGSYELEFDGRTLPSGIYFYQLRAGNFIRIKKMVLVK